MMEKNVLMFNAFVQSPRDCFATVFWISGVIIIIDERSINGFDYGFFGAGTEGEGWGGRTGVKWTVPPQ